MDNTEEICKKYGAKYVNRRGGNFYGDAIRTGFDEAYGKYIVVMDADGSHGPDDIVRLYDAMRSGKPDLVIGSRYCKGGNTDNNFVLKAMSWILNFTYRVAFGLKVKDMSDSFRLYKAEQAKRLSLECDNFDIVEEILIKLYLSKKGFTITEVPIYFNKRQGGKSKRDLGKFILSYAHTMNKLLKMCKRAKDKQK